MDPRGLVAFIVTFHEMAALLGLLAGIAALLLALLLTRKLAGRFVRVFLVVAVGAGVAALVFGGASRVFGVSPLDVEVVKVSD